MEGKSTIICSGFSLEQTLECGQCFRWRKHETGKYTVLAAAKKAVIEQVPCGISFLNPMTEEDTAFWNRYFDMERDYAKIQAELSGDSYMKKAIAFGRGIHILQQPFFETLISFIISQNNHIPRIQGILERISQAYGTPLGEGDFTFPTAEVLAEVSEEDFRSLGCGFRAKYLQDAARKVAEKQILEERLQQLSAEEARQELMQIYGVGQKVADCVLLFALGKWEVFPADVWIRRVMSEIYFEGKEISVSILQEEAKRRFGAYRGLAQQYLFYYGRSQKRIKKQKGEEA